MLIYWQVAEIILLLLVEQRFADGSLEKFLPRISHHGFSEGKLLDAIADRNDLRRAAGGMGKSPLTRIMIPLSRPYITDEKLSNKKKKGRRKHFSPTSVIKDKYRRKYIKDTRKRVGSFMDKFSKLRMKRDGLPPIDRIYRKQIVEHCDDIYSYYFPPLDECYRIYQTPHNNLDVNYVGDRNELAYGTSQYDYMHNCWQLYRGKLLDIGAPAIGEKMQLVKQMAMHFYQMTVQHGAIRVGFMISRNHELMSQNGTFYDVLDGVYVKMHPTQPCDGVCCVVMKFAGTNKIEFEQESCDYAFVPNFFCQRQGNV